MKFRHAERGARAADTAQSTIGRRALHFVDGAAPLPAGDPAR